MGARRGLPAAIAGLLTALWLAGCGGSLNSSHQVSGGEQLSGVQHTAAQSGAGPTSLSPTGSTQVAQFNGGTQATAGAYRIGSADMLDITVFKVPDLSKTVQVSETGSINLPLVGEVQAAGKTTQELERVLTSKLGATYLQNPQVSVLVKENNSQRVTIQGAVEKPGVYPVKGKTSLLELVAMAGGFKSSSDSTVLVLRQEAGKRAAAKFDVDNIQKGRADDPTMQAGDVVVAGTSAIRAGFNNVLKALPIAGLFAFL
jgi:polysaccharide biosynthesis/export protein